MVMQMLSLGILLYLFGKGGIVAYIQIPLHFVNVKIMKYMSLLTWNLELGTWNH